MKLVNNEVKVLFARTIAAWFRETIIKDDRKSLFEAIWNSDTDTLTLIINQYLYKTISYYDYNENFYHAFLAGLLSGAKNINVESNREAGTGRADIIIKDLSRRYVAIFEVKRAKNWEAAPKLCEEALKQIDEKKYYTPFMDETVFKYGITFFKKNCMIKKE